MTYTLTSRTKHGKFRLENTGLSGFSDTGVIGIKAYALLVQVNFILPDGTAQPISCDPFQNCGFEGQDYNLVREDF